jgi:hypothetical protein
MKELMTFDIVIPGRGITINRDQEVVVVTVTCEEEMLKAIWRKHMENEKTMIGFLDWLKKKCIENDNVVFGEKPGVELLTLSNGHTFPYKVEVCESPKLENDCESSLQDVVVETNLSVVVHENREVVTEEVKITCGANLKYQFPFNPVTDGVPELIKETFSIFSQNRPKSVKLCVDGIGGTYFIVNEDDVKIAVFKPADEEPGAENNPKGMNSVSDSVVLPPGGGAIREVAAYLLDRGFAGVPETYLISDICNSSFGNRDSRNNTPVYKSGSLQRYVENSEDQDLSSSRFSVTDVHKIGILDLRLLNLDRNIENILILSHSDPRLIPIDHTYILPPKLDISVWFEWQYWKQSKQPFSKEHLAFISSLDIENDAVILSELGIESAAVLNMMISSMILKIAAVNYGYCLTDIAEIVTKKKDKKTDIERILTRLEEKIKEERNCGAVELLEKDGIKTCLDILERVVKEELEQRKK